MDTSSPSSRAAERLDPVIHEYAKQALREYQSAEHHLRSLQGFLTTHYKLGPGETIDLSSGVISRVGRFPASGKMAGDLAPSKIPEYTTPGKEI